MEKDGPNVVKMVDGRVLLNPTTAGHSRGPNVATVTFSPHHTSYPEKGYSASNGGVVNHGYVGSSTTIRSDSTPSVQVVREQYWTWFSNWSRRERILFLVVTILTLIVLALVLLVSLINRKEDLTVSPPGSWFSWSL